MASISNPKDDEPKTLQPELVIDILSRLPVLSLLQSKLVSKSWLAMARETHFLSLHLSRAARSDPCLILCCDYPYRNKLYFLDSSRRALKKLDTHFISSMVEFDVVGSCNGLLCLSDTYNDVLHVHNPLTGSSVELPEGCRYSNQTVVHGFGFDPWTGVYKVVRVIYFSHRRIGILRGCRFTPENSEVQVLSLGGEPGWRSAGKAPCHLLQCASQVLVKGRLHWVGWRHRLRSACMIMSLDLQDEEFKEVPKPDGDTLDGSTYHLLVIRGCLSAAAYCNGELEIWVMKEYDVKESWAKEMKIGTYVPKVLRETDVYIRIQNGKVLCLLESGEVLMEYARRALVCYDPKKGSFRELVFKDLPSWFETVVHVGSFNWVNTPIHV